MFFRLFSYKLILSLLLISVLFIAFGIQNSRTAPTQNLNRSYHVGNKKTKLAPAFNRTLPIDWTQPVNVISLADSLSFSLSFSNDDEYLLIINNLNRSPQQPETVQLSASLDTIPQATNDCYFQNTKPLHYSPPLPQHVTFSFPQHTESKAVWKSAWQQNTKLKPAKDKRSFFLFVTDGSLSDKNQYTRITGRLIQQSPRVAIYLDHQQRAEELATGLVTEIIEKLENEVLDRIARQCGPIRDVDQSGRFTVLLSPWLGKLQGGKTSINGFVRPSDFRKTVPEPFSNHCDMLYLNSALRPGQELLDLLSHEVTHAAVSSIRTEQDNSGVGPLVDEEDWLNEGIAHIMEPGHTNRDYRISEFYRSPESYPLIVPDYYRAQLWRNHGCRGAVNLFLEWCNQIQSEQSFPYRFTHHRLTGTEKIEQITSIPFSELFRQWSLHLASQALNRTTHEKSTPFPPKFRCGKFLSTGPALRTWELSHNAKTSFNILASASGFLRLKPDNNTADHDQIQRVRIHVKDSSNLQLTLLKIPKDGSPLTLTAKFSSPDIKKQISEFREVRLSCVHPAQSEVESISLEFSGAYLSRIERQPRQFQASALKTSLTTNTESLDVTFCGTQNKNRMQTTEFLVRIPQYDLKRHSKPDCLTFKAIVKLDQRQWIAGQCDLELPNQATQRLAELSSQATKK